MRIGHTRVQRLRRSFAHRGYLWLVDLDALPALPRWLRSFARFRAGDHLTGPGESIRERLDAWLATRGVHLGGGRVLMLASARNLGYVFNPLSVYWCHSASGALECVVAEVHNTYGQRHCYLLRPDAHGRDEVDKAFYVSPFLTVDGRYVMRLPLPDERLAVSVTLRQDGRTAFTATLTGTRRPATPRQLLRLVARWPLVTLRTSLLIRRHGIALWLRRLPVVRRPGPPPADPPPAGPRAVEPRSVGPRQERVR